MIFGFFLPLWSICKVKIYFSNCCQYAYEIVKSSNHQIIKSSKIRIFKYRNFWKPPKSTPDYSKWFQTTRNIILMIFLVVWHHFESSGIDFEGFQIFRSLKILDFVDFWCLWRKRIFSWCAGRGHLWRNIYLWGKENRTKIDGKSSRKHPNTLLITFIWR